MSVQPADTCARDTLEITVGESTMLSPEGTASSASLSVSGTGTVAAFYPASSGCGYRISTDGGLTWSDEIALPAYMANGTKVRGGPVIHLGERRFMGPGQPLEVDRYEFTDDFRHFETGKSLVYLPNPTDETISGFMFFAPTFDHGKIVQLPNGDLLAFMYGYVKGDIRTRVMAVKSTDLGHTWRYHATVDYDDRDPNPELAGEYTGYSENSLALLPNGQLLAIMRTQGSHHPPDFRPLYVSWSDDLGKTWTKPVPTSPHLMNIWPMLAVLDNSVVACLYGRPGIHVAFSTDNGHSFGDRISFLPTPHPEQGELVRVGPNKLLALVCMGPRGIRAYPITVRRIRDPASGAIDLIGRVMDQQGHPIAAATVEMDPNRYSTHYQPIQPDRGYPTVQTDAEGGFRFEGVKPRETVLTAEADGHAPSLQHVNVRAGIEPVRITLKPGRVVRGRVADEMGMPIAGMCVHIDDWHGHTDLSGTFAWPIERTAPQHAKVRLVKQYYAQQCRTMSLAQIERPIVSHRLPYPGDGLKLSCVRVESPPPIDAKFDDDAWRHCPVAAEYWFHAVPDAAQIPIKARFAYDNEHLYVIVRVGPGETTALSNEDMIEIYIAKDMDRRLSYQFAYNVRGRVGSAFGWNITESEQVHTSQESDGGWTLSTAIRWIILGVKDPQSDAALGLGVAHVHGLDGEETTATKSPPAVFRYGRLALAPL